MPGEAQRGFAAEEGGGVEVMTIWRRSWSWSLLLAQEGLPCLVVLVILLTPNSPQKAAAVETRLQPPPAAGQRPFDKRSQDMRCTNPGDKI
jgi:hypothetical protein